MLLAKHHNERGPTFVHELLLHDGRIGPHGHLILLEEHALIFGDVVRLVGHHKLKRAGGFFPGIGFDGVFFIEETPGSAGRGVLLFDGGTRLGRQLLGRLEGAVDVILELIGNGKKG